GFLLWGAVAEPSARAEMTGGPMFFTTLPPCPFTDLLNAVRYFFHFSAIPSLLSLLYRGSHYFASAEEPSRFASYCVILMLKMDI
ncbi:hypothetical protein, partial [Dickeya fangzhongdai]|uniref:hypothetical protein n=1 Tax=Dickeya fangzhongdai TaxID=1778540 RepID=UPI001A8C8853